MGLVEVIIQVAHDTEGLVAASAREDFLRRGVLLVEVGPSGRKESENFEAPETHHLAVVKFRKPGSRRFRSRRFFLDLSTTKKHANIKQMIN